MKFVSKIPNSPTGTFDRRLEATNVSVRKDFFIGKVKKETGVPKKVRD